MVECRVLGVVPVRLGSTRLPAKALLPAGDLPLFAHLARALERTERVDRVIVATDAPEVEAACAEVGLEAMRTATTHRTGSERCAEVAAQVECEVVIDAQGDWPEIPAADLDRLARVMTEGDDPVATLVRPLTDPAIAANPNVVKVVGDATQRALYFSRLPVPYAAAGAVVERLRHIGVYAFRRDVLLGLSSLPECAAAACESLEQLRFMHGGVSIRLVRAEGEAWGIETKADYDAFLLRLA